jgi:hypothetical protein
VGNRSSMHAVGNVPVKAECSKASRTRLCAYSISNKMLSLCIYIFGAILVVYAHHEKNESADNYFSFKLPTCKA